MGELDKASEIIYYPAIRIQDYQGIPQPRLAHLFKASFLAWRSSLLPSCSGILSVFAGPGWALKGANLGSWPCSWMGWMLNSFSP